MLGHRETRVSRKGMETSSLVIFGSELDVWFQGVDVLEELWTMFCLLDDKGVIHIPQP